MINIYVYNTIQYNIYKTIIVINWMRQVQVAIYIIKKKNIIQIIFGCNEYKWVVESINSKGRNNFSVWIDIDKREALLRVLKEWWREETYGREDLKISKIFSPSFYVVFRRFCVVYYGEK